MIQGYKSKFYDQYYSQRSGKKLPGSLADLKSRRPFYLRVIKRLFPIDLDSRILELGCGFGAFLHQMRLDGFHNSTGVESSSEMFEASQTLGIDGIIFKDALEFLRSTPDGAFDLVVAIDVIEHFDKTTVLDLIMEIYRVTSPGGAFITHQPNAEGVFGSAIRYADFTHDVAYTRSSIEQVCRASGFDSVESFEDKPLVYNFPSLIRRILWTSILRPVYLFMSGVENGSIDRSQIFSKNLLSIARKI